MSDLNDIVKLLEFWAFWVFLFVGAISTFARIGYYRAHGYRRPKLLVRDVVVIGGFALSFGLVLVARAASAAGYDTSGLTDNLLWTLATGIPALAAVAVYAYFEIFIIERGVNIDQDHSAPMDDHGPSDS